MLTEKPPLHPRRRPEILAAVQRILAEGAWTRLEGAPETEADLRAFHGGEREVWWLSSGTAALEAILIGHGIGPGDEVVTTPYTWGATVSAVLAIGAVPVFADVDPLTGLIDADDVPARLTPRTKAVLGVHLFGRPFAADRLRALCDARRILLLEDGSQAHGARLHGRRVGAFGHASAFSCMAYKPLGGTEGGYALFADPAAAERAYLHGKHPRGLDPARAAALAAEGLLDSLQLGWRPCALGAELARLALPFLDEENAARRANAEHLRTLLADLPGVSLPPEPPGTESVHHLLSLLYDETATGLPRAEFLERLRPLGVETFVYIPTPIHRLRRLDWTDRSQPPVFWHRQLRESGIRYHTTSLPGAERRSATSFEMGWNWTEPAPRAMEQLAAALRSAAGAPVPRS